MRNLASKYIFVFYAENDDYTPIVQTVTFEPGETTVQVTVDTVDDLTNELDEMFTASIQSPTGGAMLGASPMATVTITDNDGMLYIMPMV